LLYQEQTKIVQEMRTEFGFLAHGQLTSQARKNGV